MGGGVGGINHLRRGERGSKDAHPYCDKDQLGYMWSREDFDHLAIEGSACIACVRTLERDALAEQLAALKTSIKLTSD